VGAIYHPKAVIVNPVFLQTLPFKEVMNGLAEAIKHSLTDSKAHYELVKKYVAEYKFDPIITASLQYKTSIVQQDLNEQHLRKVLNFGHTAGHAIETLLLERKEEVKHGFCIAYGIVTALELSKQVYKQKEDKWSEITEKLRKYYPVRPLKKQDVKKIINIMRQDKKNVKALEDTVEIMKI
jgi:3-dehydroquinate synthase